MDEPEYRHGAWWYRRSDGTVLRWNESAQAWEPAAGPPGPEAPEPEAREPQAWDAARADPYRPPGSRARWAIRALLALAVLCGLAAVSDGFEYELLDRLERGADVSETELTSSDLRQRVIGLMQFILYVAVVILFLRWFFRAYRNLPRLGAADLRYRPGWAIGAWFVPILNLFRPKQIANDIWRASDPDLPERAEGDRWRGAPIPRALFGWWWAVWLVMSIFDNASFRLALTAETASELQSLAAVWLVGDALTVPAAVLAALVIRRTTERQETRARLFDAPGTHQPIP